MTIPKNRFHTLSALSLHSTNLDLKENLFIRNREKSHY